MDSIVQLNTPEIGSIEDILPSGSAKKRLPLLIDGGKLPKVFIPLNELVQLSIIFFDSEKFFNNFGSSSSTSSDCQNFIFDIEEHEVNIITNDNTAKMFFIFISLCLRCIVIY